TWFGLLSVAGPALGRPKNRETDMAQTKVAGIKHRKAQAPKLKTAKPRKPKTALLREVLECEEGAALE
uniref:hypothetical protein n=1 Tax=Roseovarius aestuariivivens TaxID=1888910 RepID=UPI001AEC68F5